MRSVINRSERRFAQIRSYFREVALGSRDRSFTEKLILVRFVFVLDIVVQGEDQLVFIFDFLRADAFELGHDGRSVVVGHAAVRADR